jgi:hypothetical protein
MCVRCEFQLFEDHRASETGCDTLCPKCGKFPASATGDECYHCFPVGNIAHECPKCNGKPWSEDFLAVQVEGESDDPIDRIM